LFPLISKANRDNSGDPKSSAPAPRLLFPASHRGRQRLHEIKESNRNKILEPLSTATFWKDVRRLIDPAPIPIAVTANSLKDVFEKRLNSPPLLPESFDAPQHKMNRLLAEAMPETITDSTPEQFFTREWTKQDIEWLKNHIWGVMVLSL
jgi:hypothetical protein